MSKSFLFLFAVASLVGMTFAGCSSDDVNPEVTVQEGQENYFEKAINFTSDGGTIMVSFTTNVDWTLKASDTQGGSSWCSVSQGSGSKGTFNIAITATSNTGYDDRNTVFVLTAGNIVKTVIVNQKQKNAITLTTDRFEVANEGGTILVEVKSNVNYTYEIPEKYTSWISAVSNTRGLSAKTLSFKIEKSEEYDKREGEIIFKSDDITEKVKVYQTGSAILVLSQNEYTVGPEGGTISVDISSNFNFEVDMPSVSWLKAADKTRAVSSHTLNYIVSPNATYDDREAVIVFKDTKSGKQESVTVTQRQLNGILLSTGKAEIGQDGGTFYVEVNSNVDYQIEIPSSCKSWINQASNTRSLSKTTPAFKVATSEEYDKREGEIYFKYGDIKETFKVYQSGGEVLILSSDKYEISGKEATLDVVLKSNIEYAETISDESWISSVSSRAASSSTKRYKISANETGKERKGYITYTSSSGNKTAVVTIIQQPIKKLTDINIKLNVMQEATYGGYWYIGKYYEFYAVPTNSECDYEFEYSIEDPTIAEIKKDGASYMIYTKDYGTTNLIVKDKVSGKTKKASFGTLVQNFTWQINADSYWNSFPQVTLAVGDTYKISNYSCTPSYATNLFSDLSAFKFWENVGGIMGMLDAPTHISIAKDGTITGVSVGRTGMGLMGTKIFRSGDDQRFYVNVISEYTENEYNNEFSSANTIKDGQAMKFSLSSTNDVDVFKFNKSTSTRYIYINVEYLGENGATSGQSRSLSYDVYDYSGSRTGGGTLSFDAKGQVSDTMMRYAGTGSYAFVRFSYDIMHGSNMFPQGSFKVAVSSNNN